MKALVGAFNQEKALVGAFSVIVQLGTDGALHSTTQGEVVTTGGGEEDAGDREPGAATSA